jgi:AcrR family transcriptional regulator
MPEPESNAEKILHVAIQILAQKGYGSTSTREIVAAAGVTKPMLYYYFGNKEGLCKAGIRHFSQQFFTLIASRQAIPRDPRGALVEFIWTHFEFMRDHHDVGLFYTSLFFGPERRKFKEDFETLAAEMRGMTSDLVRRAAEGGVIRPDCQEDFALAIHGLIDVWHRTSLIDGIELTHALAERIVDNLLDGFGAR